MKNADQNLFRTAFLNKFVFDKSALPFKGKELIEADKELSKFEQLFINIDMEKTLISKNLLLASFAISKAEQSKLTIGEAEDLYEKVTKDNRRPVNNYEKKEFYNIVKTFRTLNEKRYELKDLSLESIKELHNSLTEGLDEFYQSVPELTLYKSGFFRDNNNIYVGEYHPADYLLIEKSLEELIRWLKNDFSTENIAAFHTSLYAVHPFNNGNKRVCRVLEHLLFRSIGLNQKNLYSTSYYYHKEKPRYYKHMLNSLLKNNLNYFTSFILEALLLSIISVFKTSLEINKSNFIRQIEEPEIRGLIKPLVKKKEVQFKNLYRASRNKMARQTFVNYLNKALDLRVVQKRDSGRTSFYKINAEFKETDYINKWVKFAKTRLPYIPPEYLFS